MKRRLLLKRLRLVAAIAVVYIVLDLPLRLVGFDGYIGFEGFGTGVGIKSFLPAETGLLFGWCGPAGCALGALISSLIGGASAADTLFEIICSAALGLGMWLLWHTFARRRRPQLKSWSDLARFCLFTAALSALCGLIAPLFSGAGYTAAGMSYALTAAVGYAVMTLLIGIPVTILFTSVIFVTPIQPSWSLTSADGAGTVTSDPATLEALNESLEECALSRGLSRKTLFSLQSCVEEVALRFIAASPEAEVAVEFYVGNSVSVRFACDGAPYNPLRPGKDETEEDLIGLKLIKYRALRFSYGREGPVNRVHIVV